MHTHLSLTRKQAGSEGSPANPSTQMPLPNGSKSSAQPREGAYRKSFSQRLPLLYVIFAAFLGGMYAVETPPFFAPDEVAHAMRGVQVANGGFLATKNSMGQGESQDQGFSITADAFARVLQTILRQPSHARAIPRIAGTLIDKERRNRWAGGTFFDSFPMTRIYPPTLYIPGAIGWRLGRFFNYTILHSLLLARLLNLAAAIVLGWTALHLCRGCRESMMALLLTPALLSLDGSCSQDALIIASSALAFSIASRAFAECRLYVTWELLTAGVVLCVVGMIRPPYMLLLLTLTLPNLELRRFEVRSLALPIAVILSATLFDISWYAAVRPLGFLVGPGADSAAQIAYIRYHPWQALLSVVVGLLRDIPVLLSSLVEAGSGDVRPPRLAAAIAVLLLAGIFLNQSPLLLRRVARRASLALALSICVAMAFAEYIIWTVPRAPFRVEGLQIRHFLVLLPLAALLGGLPRRFGVNFSRAALLALPLLDLLLLFYDAHVFYGQGTYYALRLALHR